jgi:hypothetical protein
MPLFTNARAPAESAAPKENQTNQLTNRPRVPAHPRPAAGGAQFAQANRSDSAEDPFSGQTEEIEVHDDLDVARTAAVIAKQLILTNAADSLVAQARLLNWNSLRLLT